MSILITRRGVAAVLALVVWLVLPQRAHCFYNPSTGRWLSRDPLEETGGANLYGCTGNDPIAVIDVLGMDFIAIADRPVDPLPGAIYHYSVQYWETFDCPPSNDEVSISEWLKRHTATKRGSTELLVDEGWKVWRLYGKKWKVESTSVSVIKYSDTGTSFSLIYLDRPELVRTMWTKILLLAKGYKYAEQDGFAGSFKNWPNSRYDLGDDANNSNTYARYIVEEAGMEMHELRGQHPGRLSPQPIRDDYGGRKPFKGKTPPPPARL